MKTTLNPNRHRAGFTWLGTVVNAATAAYGAYQNFAGTGTAGSSPAVVPSTAVIPVTTSTSMGTSAGVPGSVVPMMGTVPGAMMGQGGLFQIGQTMGRMIGPIVTRLGVLSRGTAARKLLQIAKFVGIEVAATVLGLSIGDALGLIGSHGMRRRRSRGISARDLRTTRRTTRRLIRAGQDLSALAHCFKVKRRSPCS